MAVAQLSVFIESKVGHLKRVLEVFVENDISVKGYARPKGWNIGTLLDNLTRIRPARFVEYLQSTAIPIQLQAG